MTRHSIQQSCLGALTTAGILLSGCTTTEGTPPCVWIHSPDECPENNDEVGGDGPSEFPCITDPDGTTRTIHQCTGNLTASLSFKALGMSCPEALGSQDACDEIHVFGVDHEPYAMTQVMACCDPYDPGTSDFDEYVEYCAGDMTAQICHTIAQRLKQLIDDGELPKTAESTALQTYVAEHEEECFDTLWGSNTSMTPGQVTSSWTVPNNLAWGAVIQNLTVTVDASAITDVTLPADESDYLECAGISYNDDQIFEENVTPSPGIISNFLLASSASASVAGPVVLGDPVAGAGRIHSLATRCTAPFCSDASVTTDASATEWTLEDMNLFVEGPFTIGNEVASLDVDRASVRLYGPSHGRIMVDATGDQVLEIPARGAHFTVAGASSVGVRLLLLSNSTPITAHPSGATWIFDEFTLDYVDRSGETWVLDLSTTTWK